MLNGKLVVMEGSCDGIGKSTQFELLRNRLIMDGEEIVTHHFPSYGTYQGALVEKYLSGEFGSPKDLSPYFINSLYAVDRVVTWHVELKKELENHKNILLDRYTTSSLIYQSALIEDIQKRKDFIDYVCDFEYCKLEIPEPNHVIFLYAPFELVTQMRNRRKQNEGIVNDVHERDLVFMKKVYDNAMFLADYLKWDKVQCNEGNQMKSIDEIHNDVYKIFHDSSCNKELDQNSEYTEVSHKTLRKAK